MPCVFRIGGESLDIDSLLREITIRPFLAWRKGAARLPGGNKIATNSGANFDASIAGFEQFETQLIDATEFLHRHRADIEKIMSFSGVEFAHLDFAIELRTSYTHSDVLPLNFLRAVAQAGVTVELSHYRSEHDEERTADYPQ
jgi:hypothetical protein